MPELPASRGDDIVTTERRRRCSAPTTRPASPRSWPPSPTSSPTPSCRAPALRIAFKPGRGDRPRRDALRRRALRRAPRLHARRLDRRRAPGRDLLGREVTIDDRRGRAIHPGCAKGELVNALKLAAAHRRRAAARPLSPETTEGREGFVHPYDIARRLVRASSSAPSSATSRRAARPRTWRSRAGSPPRSLAAEPRGAIEVEVAPSTANMRDDLSPRPEIVGDAEEALRRVGLEPRSSRSAAAPTARCSPRWACRPRTSSPAATSPLRARVDLRRRTWPRRAATIVRPRRRVGATRTAARIGRRAPGRVDEGKVTAFLRSRGRAGDRQAANPIGGPR